MPIFIDQVTTDVEVTPGTGTSRGGGATSEETAETQAENLRGVIRAILREELERALRLALPRR
ncbi:MAG: hypothetical protein ACOYOH_21450 [Paracraurococcus sp.]